MTEPQDTPQELKTTFENALNQIKTDSSLASPSNEVKLKMYAFYKQATQGDVSGKKPGMTDFVGKAKYAAWEKLAGTSAADAMQGYLELFESLKP